jgi:hypothetical protein
VLLSLDIQVENLFVSIHLQANACKT